jgi:hypothetical protein
MRWAAATVVVTVTAACGSSAAAPGGEIAHASAACGPRAAKTITADSRARVYAAGSGVYGCAPGRRAFLLGRRVRSHPPQSEVGEIALTGAVVGYAASESGVDTLSTQVVVRRLDTGRTLHDVNAVRGTLGPEFFEGVDALVVKADGAVAWIARGGSIVQKEGTVEVNRIDRRGEATLDSTTHSFMGSLTLRGTRLSWRHAKALRTSTLL